jgi:hypothetical protein
MKTALLALFISFPAFAAPVVTTCQLPEASASVEVSFTLPDEANKFGVATSKLVLNEQEVPMIRTSCFYKNVPGQRGFLCAHQNETGRFDVYPRLAKNEDGSLSGAVAKVLLVTWSEDGVPTSFVTEDCR